MLSSLFEAVENTIAKKGNCILAIDGMCGSGKTTLSALLAEKYNGRVVHMDHFFLPPELRTQKRLSEPGENVHYERFLSELKSALTHPASAENPLYYNIFSCQSGSLSKAKLPPCGLTVIEGSYSLHPKLQELYDIKVFCLVSDAEQERRLKLREGENNAKLQAFFDKWIPFENRYFEAYNIKNICDLIIDMERTTC